METKEFKKILRLCLEKNGFSKTNKDYYLFSDKIITVINVQKSNYGDNIYVNYAFFLRDLHKDMDKPKYTEGDVRGRFRFDYEGSTHDSYTLTDLDAHTLEESINNNLLSVIQPVVKYGIAKYFDLFPKAIHTATITLREYLDKDIACNHEYDTRS